MRDLYLGIDLGTSSMKMVLIDGSRETVWSGQQDYEILRPEEGYEENPGDWTDAIVSTLASLDEDIRRNIRSIAFSSQMPTLVVTDRQGKAIGNAVLWCDDRAASKAEDILKSISKEDVFARTGIMLDGRYLGPMYMRIREQNPDLPEDHYILSAGDYLYMWFTGTAATNPSLASGYGFYNIKTGTWDEELMKLCGVHAKSLPPIFNSSDSPGKIKAEIAGQLGLNPDTEIKLGVADSVAAVFGTGVSEPGEVCVMCGSSTAMIAVTEDVNTDSNSGFFITPLGSDKTFGLETDILSTGKTIDWLINMANSISAGKPITYEELFAKAGELAPDFGGVFATPYLMGGEQGVLWDNELQAMAFGVNQSHGFYHIAGAFIAGICYEMKRCIEAFKAAGEIRKLVVSGPVSGSEVFMQMLTDITALPCERSEVKDASAMGAAFIATGTLEKQGGAGISRKSCKTYTPGINSEAYQKNYETYKIISAKSKL